MPKRILTDFVIDKIAAVDKPCQEHAVATITKRAPEEQSKKFDMSSLVDRIAKDYYSASIAPSSYDIDNGAEDFSEAFKEIIDQKQEWKLESEVRDALYPYFDALNRSIVSICCETTGTERLLEIRNSVSQFLAAVAAKFPQLPEKVAAAADAADDLAKSALASIAMLRLNVAKAKANEMLECQEKAKGGNMPRSPAVPRGSQPMVKTGWTDAAREAAARMRMHSSFANNHKAMASRNKKLAGKASGADKEAYEAAWDAHDQAEAAHKDAADEWKASVRSSSNHRAFSASSTANNYSSRANEAEAKLR